MFACSFPSMLARALALWSVVVFVQGCNIRTIDLMIVYMGGYLCKAGCLTLVALRNIGN